MPTDPAQFSLVVFETTLVIAGGLLLLGIVFSARRRARWTRVNALATWPVSISEFMIYVALILFTGMFLQVLIANLAKKWIEASADQTALQMTVYGAAMHLGFILGYLAFPRVRRSFYSDYGANPVPLRSGPSLSWLTSLRYGAGTVMAALPILIVISLGWEELLRLLSLPEEPQDIIAVLAVSKSLWVVGGMFFVACVIAPISEELLFRAGLYRFIRQKLGRSPALILSGLCFATMHMNWASFLPLAVLGMILAVVYEATGSIRVPILAHAFFNLNTILLVLSGMSNVAQ